MSKQQRDNHKDARRVARKIKADGFCFELHFDKSSKIEGPLTALTDPRDIKKMRDKQRFRDLCREQREEWAAAGVVYMPQ